MTHTLHRRPEQKVKGEDFTILCMAAQGYNDHGAGEKLKEIYKLVASTSPDNLADDNLGGRFTGHTDAEILDHMGYKAYIGAAWRTVDSRAITSSGNIMIRDAHGHYEKIRASVSSRVDGTYSVYAIGTVASL